MRVKGGDEETGEANKRGDTRRFHGPPTEALTLEMSVHACDQGLGFRSIEAGREIAHDLGIGVDRGKGVEIILKQSAKDQALGAKTALACGGLIRAHGEALGCSSGR